MPIPDRMKGAVFFPLGVMLLFGCFLAVRSTREFLRRSQIAPGIVTAEPFGPHHVQIQFRTSGGDSRTYSQNGQVTLHTGDQVAVLYDPHDPRADPCVNRWPAIWGDAAFLGFMGVVFTTVGLILLLKAARV